MKRTILIVDDNNIELKILKSLLQQNYNILEAQTGEEAIKIIKDNYQKISAVVLDIIMPGMGGFEALKTIKQNAAFLQIPVIIDTIMGDEETREKAIKLGADGFITKPYNRTMLIHVVKNAIRLHESSTIVNTIGRDRLTGLLNKDSFVLEAENMILKKEKGFYTIACMDIDNFKVINDQYGTAKGDEILRHIANTVSLFIDKVSGLACRYSDDKFALLYPTKYKDSEELKQNHVLVTSPKCMKNRIKIRIGRYIVLDSSVPFNTMFDRAVFTEESLKGRYDAYIAEYSDQMLENIKKEQEIIMDMNDALANNEFVFFLQPQFNHKTKSMIGAEALVRWKRNNEYISPSEFVPIFEKNGFIYELDKYIWNEVCKQLRKWLDEGINPLPISVNISRVDIFHEDFIDILTGIITKYNIPNDLIRLEVTESAFSDETRMIIDKINYLIDLGYTIEIDDFGSGYSSLNSLKDVKAQILKLDLRFLEKTNNTSRSGNIIESVIRMARWLGMAVIAEGVEDIEHADFLKSIGCYYIQGFFYSKPISITEYEKLFDNNSKEQKLTRLITVKNHDNNDFWNASSMDTLIFNSYVGGACIFEFKNGKAELLRTNDQFDLELGNFRDQNFIFEERKNIDFFDDNNRNILFTNIHKAIKEKHESSCEIVLSNETIKEYFRITVREIASTQDRYLIYCVIVNISEQRRAEINEKRIAERMKAIMDNTKSGITAVVVKEDRQVEYILVNDRFYELMGYTREQFNMEVKLPFDRIISEDYDNTIDELAKLTKVGDSTTVIMRALKRDGTMVWLRDDVTIIKLDGVDKLVQLSNFIDISEQAVAEEQEHRMYEQLQAIMKSINGGVTATIIKDGKLVFILANDRYYEQLGYTKEEYDRLLVDKFSPVIEEDRERVREEFIEGNKHKMEYSIEYRIKRPNGDIRYIIARTGVIRLFGVKEDVHLCIYNDITDIREMQRKEKELSLQLQTIMANVSGGIVASKYIDKDNIDILFSNDYFYEMFGYTKKEWDQEITNNYQLIHPDDRERVKKCINKIICEKKPYTYEYRCYKKDGSIIWIQCRNTVVVLNDIEKEILLGITTDVTDLRMAELNERNSLSTLNAIMNNLSGALVVSQVVDDKEEFILINKKFYEIFGDLHKKEYQYGIKDNFQNVHEDDKLYVHQMFKQAVTNDEEVVFEYRVRKRNNKIIWIKQRIVTTIIEGIIGKVQLSLIFDVTKEKHNELELEATADKLRAVMNHSGNGISVVAISEKPDFIMANSKFYELIGYTKEEVQTNAFGNGISIIHPDDHQTVLNAVMEAKKTGLDTVVECRLNRKDGSFIWVRSVITMTNLKGVSTPVQIVTYLDITSEKENNTQLEFLNDSAHDILAEKDTNKAIYQTLDKVMKYFDADRGYIIEIDFQKKSTNNTYELCEKGVISQKNNLQDVPFSTNDFWYQELKKNKYLIFNDIENLSDEYGEMKQLLTSQKIESIINVALYEKGNIIGFVGVDNPKSSLNQVSRLMGLSDYFAILLNRRDNEKKINVNYEIIKTMMNDTPGGFCRMSVIGNNNPTLIYVNKGLCKMLGYGTKEFITKYQDNCYGFLLDIDLDATNEAVRKSQFDGGQFSIKCRLVKKDGSYFWSMVFGRFVQDEVGNLFLSNYFNDISDQKKEEENQKKLLDNLLCGAALYEFDGKNINVIHINDQYWKLVNRDRLDYSKTSVFDAVHEADREALLKEVAAAIRFNREAVCDCRILYGESDYRPFHLEANIEKQDNGNYLLYTTYVPINEETMSLKQMIPIALSTMMSKINDIAYIKDTNLKFLAVSKPLFTMSSYNNEREMIGKTAYDVYDEDVATRCEALDMEIIQSGQTKVDIIEHVKTKDGFNIALSSSKYPIIDSLGNVIGVYGISRDITEEKQKESQIELVNRAIPGGVASYIAEKGIIKPLYFNEGFYSFSGYNKEEFIEMTKDEPLALVMEEDRHIIRDQMKILLSEFGSVQTAYYRCLLKDGSYRWMCLNASISETNENQSIINCLQIDVTKEKLKELELRVNEEAYRIAIEHSDQIICKYDIQNKRLYLDKKTSDLFTIQDCIDNIPYSEIVQKNISKETIDDYVKFYEAIICGKKENSAVFEKQIDGKFFWIKAVATTIFDDENKPLTAIITYSNITEQIAKEAIYNKWKQSILSRDFYSFKLFTTNLNKNRSYEMIDGGLFEHDFIVNDSMPFLEITKAFAERYVRKEDRELICNFTDSDRLLANYYRNERIGIVEFCAKIYNGKYHWIKLTIELIEANDSNDILAFLMFEDINETKRKEIKLLEKAETDSLTGLLNRSSFIPFVKEKTKNLQDNKLCALFMMDVDDFKTINDTYGHVFGDEVLIDVGKAIKATISQSDLTCRIGGDEFMIFINDLPNIEAISKIVSQITAGIKKMLKNKVNISLSIGISICPTDGDDFNTLYLKADKALYYVKEHSKNGFALYDETKETQRTGFDRNNTDTIINNVPTEKPVMLIVEEDKSSKEILRKLFEEEYLIEITDKGVDALKYVKENAYSISIIVLDIELPDMSGFEVLDKVKNKYFLSNIPVIVVSNNTDGKSINKAITFGATDYVIKPLIPELMKFRVDSVIIRTSKK